MDCDDGVPSFSYVATCFKCDSSQSAVKSLNKFRGMKCLSINLPFPTQENDNIYLFKWMVKLSNNCLDSFLFLSPSSLCCNTNINGNGQDDDDEEVPELKEKKLHIVDICLRGAIVRFGLLLYFIATPLLLEKISISDTSKRG